MTTKRLDIKVNTTGTQQAETRMKRLSTSIAGTIAKFTALAVAARGVLNFMKSSVQAYMKQEQAEKSLQVALGKTSTALLKHAAALQRSTTYGDETIIQQQAFLASLKFTESQIQKIIPVALDLATATGQTLEFAVRNTAKTFSGLTGELGELVPQLRGLSKEALQSGAAVDIMRDLFSGQAAAQAETMAGKISQLSNSWGDLKEELGKFVIEATPIPRWMERMTLALQSGERRIAFSTWFIEEKSFVDEYFENLKKRLSESEKMWATVLDRIAEKREDALKDKPDPVKAFIQTLSDGETTYETWLKKQQDDIRDKEILARWQDRLNAKLIEELKIRRMSITAEAIRPGEQKERRDRPYWFQMQDIEPISKDQVEQSRKYWERTEEWAKRTADEIEWRYQSMGTAINSVISNAIISGFNEGKFAVDDFVAYLRDALIKEIIYMIVAKIISAVLGEAFGEGISGAMKSSESTAGAGGLGGTVGGSVGSNSMPTIGGVGGQVGSSNNVTLNFVNPIMDRKFVVDNVIPEIKRAARLNFN